MMKALFWKLAGGYGLLVSMAGGGLAFASIFASLALLLSGVEASPQNGSIKLWMNIGWLFGVGIVLVTVIMQIRKRASSQLATETAEPELSESMPKAIEDQQERPASRKSHQGLLVSAFWGSFFGTLLGIALGASFVLLWFSLMYSPFALQGWAEGITIEHQRTGTSGRVEPVALSGDEVVLTAFGLPVVLGAVGGAVFGGVVRVREE